MCGLTLFLPLIRGGDGIVPCRDAAVNRIIPTYDETFRRFRRSATDPAVDALCRTSGRYGISRTIRGGNGAGAAFGRFDGTRELPLLPDGRHVVVARTRKSPPKRAFSLNHRTGKPGRGLGRSYGFCGSNPRSFFIASMLGARPRQAL